MNEIGLFPKVESWNNEKRERERPKHLLSFNLFVRDKQWPRSLPQKNNATCHTESYVDFDHDELRKSQGVHWHLSVAPTGCFLSSHPQTGPRGPFGSRPRVEGGPGGPGGQYLWFLIDRHILLMPDLGASWFWFVEIVCGGPGGKEVVSGLWNPFSPLPRWTPPFSWWSGGPGKSFSGCW